MKTLLIIFGLLYLCSIIKILKNGNWSFRELFNNLNDDGWERLVFIGGSLLIFGGLLVLMIKYLP